MDNELEYKLDKLMKVDEQGRSLRDRVARLERQHGDLRNAMALVTSGKDTADLWKNIGHLRRHAVSLEEQIDALVERVNEMEALRQVQPSLLGRVKEFIVGSK